MNIDSANINPARPDGNKPSSAKTEANARSAAASQTSSGSETASSSDSVSLSSSARTLTQVEATLRSAPDVDLSRVESVRARVESGEYNIDSENLAQKLLDIES